MSTSPVSGPFDEARLRALLGIGAIAGEPSELNKVAELIATELASCVGEEAAVCLLAGDHDDLVRAGGGTPSPGAPTLLDDLRQLVGSEGIGELTGELTQSHLPLVVPPDDVVGWNARYALGGVVVLPVLVRGRLIGVIGFARAEGSAYTDADIEFAQALAGIAALSADNARLVSDSAAVLEQLRQQSELVDHVSDAIIGVDAEYRIMSWNASAERIYGYSMGEALGCDLLALLATHFRSAADEPVERDLVLKLISTEGSWRGELRERRVDGLEVQTLSAFTALTDPAGGFTGAVIVNRDITQERHKEHLATHDTLTGLPNRALVTARLERSLAAAIGTDRRLALVFLDLNGFKAINDTLGHDAGDEVLRETGRRLAGSIRAHDVVARLGGDEFLIVAEDINEEGAAILAERLVAATSEPIWLGSEARVCAPSIGIALSAPGLDTPDELLRAADEAMYEAKRARRGVTFAS